uniref:Amino acid transporter transmembrane domain-containing protein n=1 Tax=Leersia perrieri TaxID=77586 RepID=A0A0D9V7B4_9ORYZ
MTPPASSGKSSGAGGADEPLLPEFSGGGHGASVCGAVFNVSTSIIGAGIMSIPAAMRVLGVVPALLLIAAVAALSDASVEFMLRYTSWGGGGGPPSYAGIMGDAFGRAGAKVLNVCIAFTTTGTLVVYLIIIGKPKLSRMLCSGYIRIEGKFELTASSILVAGDVMSGSVGGGDEHAGVLRELFGAQWWTAREIVILVTAVVVLLPLVLRRRVGELLLEYNQMNLGL